MAAQPGEEIVASLYGDVHYFYSPPGANPPHHRFDKGSYIYLFENANARRVRVEVANHAGTEDQDAFEGFLDRTKIRYSHNQQCVVNITVDGVAGAPVIDHSQWHLPTFDPRNENKYHYRLHSLDIYFWTQADALQFVGTIRRLLSPAQCEILDEPRDSLVQKLERAAIADSAPAAAMPSFAPPLTAPVASHASESPAPTPTAFAPMAYNPAAPAAPEKIAHREKTPPPEEDDGVDPLQAAVSRDHASAAGAGGYAPGSGPSGAGVGGYGPGPLSPGFPGPPPPGTPGIPPSIHGQGFPPHQQPQFAHVQRSNTITPNGLASPGLASPYGANFPGTPGFAPPPQAAQMRPTPPQASGVAMPPPPPGGYAQHAYGQGSASPALSQQQQQQGGGEYDIHQQNYKPAEGEQAVKHSAKGSKSKIGENAVRLERGVTGMLKKFEKKWA